MLRSDWTVQDCHRRVSIDVVDCSVFIRGVRVGVPSSIVNQGRSLLGSSAGLSCVRITADVPLIAACRR
jgi:hypothetical protein